ncbi:MULTISPECIES: hypothetical protein [Rhodopseudomonas]|uniref:Replication protein n=1 Tax=Rhodopseudomonas palustris TaxID=1076 RepID=A0A0D7E200_RHOPL|nr:MULTISPECIES: hypothetical protein [Rhodopseudomonas]KIZ34838.1 hypothetical protein OO17_26365 [Rhodopseudomonas palustris]MDF3810693.1 hypothetical protein [Rhodopseudomonas sp. BAL398]WOK18483.1 hypothetical protein RBJ75_02840 [Rhodopseudomonas sp. BAL398]
MPSRPHDDKYSTETSKIENNDDANDDISEAEFDRIMRAADDRQRFEAKHGASFTKEELDQLMAALDPCDGAADPVAPDPVVQPEPVAAWSEKVTKPESERSEIVTAPPTKPLSKKVTRRFRQSDTNDRETIDKIQAFEVPIEWASTDPLVHIFTTPQSPPHKPSNDNANNIPVWDLTKDRVKLAASTWALETSGKHPVSWTLNLTPKRIAEAQRYPKGFTESLLRDLNRAFKRELGSTPLYWVSADVTKDDRLHLHGAIAADPQELNRIENVLRRVGGHGPKGVKNDRMVDLNVVRCDEGWAIYAIRNAPKVRRLITGRTSSITGPLRSEGKWFYDTVRRIMRAA